MEQFKYINKMSIEDVKWSSYFKDEVKNYEVFEKIFDNEVKNYYNIDKDINKINLKNLFLLDFYYNNTKLADFFEHIIYDTMKTIDNSVTLIYIKDKEQAFIIVKSFEMVNENKVMIPFFKYYVGKENNSIFFNRLDNSFKKNETLVVINYQN